MFRKHFKRLVCREYEKKTGLKDYVDDFSANYGATAVSDMLDIHKYLMRQNEIV